MWVNKPAVGPEDVKFDIHYGFFNIMFWKCKKPEKNVPIFWHPSLHLWPQTTNRGPETNIGLSDGSAAPTVPHMGIEGIASFHLNFTEPGKPLVEGRLEADWVRM